VYAIGPDYQGGYDQLRGFTDTFTRLGGTLANPGGKTTFTPFPTTTNFLPYLSQIRASGAKAVYAFFAGRQAIDFVTQYAQSEVSHLPLYGTALTEGTVLRAQGQAADGIWTVMNYSPDLDNATNHEFVGAWAAAHDRTPTTQAMAAYDAAAVLDAAIRSVQGTVTRAKINAALGELGAVDSPRGLWRFSATHSPMQHWYLRVVRRDGAQFRNVLVRDLAGVD
jgi:branched-chain amino acid transport system substrate-binding protein